MKNEIYKAGAGAGKTTKLTQQVVDVAEGFLKQHERYPNIVVTTFTRKATQELKERLLLKACEEQKLELLEYFSSQQRIHISTIHGVLSLFLRRYGHLFELDNNFQLINSDIANAIFKNQLRESLKTQSELLEYFSFKELLQNIKDFYPIYFEYEDVKPPTVDFLKQCLQKRWSGFKTEILKSISDIESQSDNEKWIQYVDTIKKVLGLKVEDVASALSNLPRAPVERKNKTVDQQTKDQLSKALKEAKKMFASESYNPSHWPTMVEIYMKFYEQAREVCESVMVEKIKTSSLEMQDLELLTLRIINKEPEVAAEFAKEWDYWLVDEYQDTSPIQVEILKHFISDRPHFTVGDPQQSIYLFRGADVSVFEQKQQFVKSSGGKTEELIKNYRSDPELLEFFNDTFTKLSSQFIRMAPKLDSFENKKIVSKIYQLEDKDQELEAMGSEVVRLYNEGVAFEDICILARKNDDLLKLAGFLESLKVPYHLHQSGGFNSRREIIDLTNILKFFINPHDNHNLLCVLRSPWFKASDQALIEILKQLKKQKSYWQSLKDLNVDDSQTQAAIHRLKLCLEGLKDKGYVQILEEQLSTMVDWSYYQDSSGLKEANIFKFLYQLKMAERQPSFNILEFLNNFSKKESVEETSSNSNATSSIEPSRVQLMTVHASKGLQFGYVLMPFLGSKPLAPKKSGVLFDKYSKVFSFAVSGIMELERFGSPLEDIVVAEQKQRESEEFLRVFYVALTRAKKQVILSWSKVESNSWAQHLQELFVSDKSTPNYNYTVLQQVPEAVPLSASDDQNYKPLKSAATVTEKKLSRRFSVSDVIALESEIQAKPSFQGTWESKLEPVLFGIEFHGWLESYKYNPEKTLNSLKDHHPKIYKALQHLNSQQEIPFHQICQNGFVEWGFQMQVGTHVVEGQVDLWGVVDDTLWVVDYKTGSSKSYQKSLRQLKVYALAIYKHLRPRKIKLAAAYPFEEKLFIEEFDNPDELEQQLISLLDQSASE